MISRPELIAAALHRALTWVEDHPYAGPELVEPKPSRQRDTCQRGHVGGIVERNGHRFCGECERLRKRRKA